MKLPYVPKSLPELIAEHQDRLNAVHGRGFGPTADGRYLHWDKLRHLARLADLGLLERRRVGHRRYLFWAPTDLAERVDSARQR